MTQPPQVPVLRLDLVTTTGRDYGWAPPSPSDEPAAARLRVETPHGAFLCESRLLVRGERRLLLAEFRPQGAEPPVALADAPGDLFRRYLDIGLLERLALWGLAAPARADALLCIAPGAARLLHGRRETPWAALPDTDESSLHALFRHLETSPATDSAALASDARRWAELAAGPLGRALRWTKGDTDRLLRQAILGLRRLAAAQRFESLGLLSTGPATLPGESPLLRWAPAPAAAWIDCLLEAAHDFAPAGAGAFTPLERRALERQLEDSGDAPAACEALRDGLLRLARARLSAAVWLRLLLPSGAEHTAWRLALTQPLDVREELPSTDLYVFAPVRLDPAESGMGRVLEAYEKLARHAAAEMQAIARAGGRQLDLFAPASAEGAAAAREAETPHDWVCRHALRIAAPPEPAVREAIGYLIALHTLDAEPAGRPTEPPPLRTLNHLFRA